MTSNDEWHAVFDGSTASVDYDQDSDVLYISTRLGREARLKETLPGVLWRYDRVTGDIIGVTILDYSQYQRRRIADLYQDIGTHLNIDAIDAQAMLNRAVSTK